MHEIRSEGEDAANARLIAAAPDLLEATRQMIAILESGKCAWYTEQPVEFWVSYDLMKIAIAKATRKETP